jgi:gamma-glutamyltranspeptidase/glutathione hydrolase
MAGFAKDLVGILAGVALTFVALPIQATETTMERPFSEHAMVVSACPHASEAGVEIMRRGGNAFDAAACTGFVLAVTWPEAGNLGGGGLMLARKASGEVVTLDFRETAPAAARHDMFLDDKGEVIENLSLRSPLASGIPGSVEGLLRLWTDHGSGKISRHDLLAPAIALAQDGFPLSAEIADSINKRRDRFSEHPGSAAIFVKADGSPWAEGDLLKQSDLADTLRRIARNGRDGFYDGRTAKALASQQARTGGLITLDDLAAYRSIYREPVRGEFRDYEVISMGPPSSGGILLLEMLNMLDEFPLAELKWGTPAYIHLLTEVERRAYADRAEHLADADFHAVPIEILISEGYAQGRAADISLERATPSAEIRAGEARPEPEHTTHFSVVDAAGNAVALTTTLNASFGSCIVIEGAGFLMNNEMDDFSIKPGVPNLYGVTGGEANAIQPGKRMLSSMTPTIAVRDGRAALVLGSPGGSTIITTVLQVFLNVALHGMNIQDAVAASRHHSQWTPDEIFYEPEAFPEETQRALQRFGHTLNGKPGKIGAANCILIGPDGLHGAPDPRRQSAARGF